MTVLLALAMAQGFPEESGTIIDYGMALRREELVGQLQELEGYPPALARARTMAMWMDTADTPEGAEVRGLIEDWAEEALGPEFLDRLSAFDK